MVTVCAQGFFTSTTTTKTGVFNKNQNCAVIIYNDDVYIYDERNNLHDHDKSSS